MKKKIRKVKKKFTGGILKNQKKNCVCFYFFRKFEISKTPKVQSNDFIFFGGDDFKIFRNINYKKFYIPEKYFFKTKNLKVSPPKILLLCTFKITKLNTT